MISQKNEQIIERTNAQPIFSAYKKPESGYLRHVEELEISHLQEWQKVGPEGWFTQYCIFTRG